MEQLIKLYFQIDSKSGKQFENQKMINYITSYNYLFIF